MLLGIITFRQQINKTQLRQFAIRYKTAPYTITHYPSIHEIISEDEWQISPEREMLYTSNHLIDAYLKGKTDGLNAELKLVFDQLKANIKESTHITSTITKLLRNKGIITESAYLKIINWNDFELLLFVPERNLIGDNGIDIYFEIAEIENNRKTDHFSISVSLSSKNESFSKKDLASDGYNLKHPMTIHATE